MLMFSKYNVCKVSHVNMEKLADWHERQALTGELVQVLFADMCRNWVDMKITLILQGKGEHDVLIHHV